MKIEQGIHENIDINDYHKAEGISSSGISLILDAPAKYYYQYLSGLAKKEDTASTKLGSAVHFLTLEPEIFQEHFIILPKGFDRRKKEDKELYETFLQSGKHIIKHDDFEEASSMAYAIRSNRAFKAVLEKNGKGNIESSVIWHQGDVILKSRPDWYCNDLIIDIKTTRSAQRDEFAKSIVTYGYHRQAYLATTGLTVLTGRAYKNVLLIAVESEPPYLTSNYLLTEDIIARGGDEVNKALSIYKECLHLNEWPGYPEEIQSIDLPAWYRAVA